MNDEIKAARLDEAKWWEHLAQDAHEESCSMLEPCIYCERIATLTATQ